MAESLDYDRVERDETGAGNARPGEGAELGRTWRAFVQALFDYMRGRFEPARPWIDAAQTRMEGVESDIMDRGFRAAGAAKDYVRRNPAQAAGAAALFALLLRGMKRRR